MLVDLYIWCVLLGCCDQRDRFHLKPHACNLHSPQFHHVTTAIVQLECSGELAAICMLCILISMLPVRAHSFASQSTCPYGLGRLCSTFALLRPCTCDCVRAEPNAHFLVHSPVHRWRAVSVFWMFVLNDDWVSEWVFCVCVCVWMSVI